MCDPVSIGSALLTAGGIGYNAYNEQQYVDQQNQVNKEAFQMSRDARLAEKSRQADFQAEADEGWENTLDQLTVDQDTQDRAAEEMDFMSDYDALPSLDGGDGAWLTGQDQASDLVRSTVAAQTNKAAAEARARVQALAKLTGYDGADGNRMDALTSNQDFLSTLNGLRRGSMAVANQEQNIAPAQVNQGPSYIGDIMTGAGNMGLQYGGYQSGLAKPNSVPMPVPRPPGLGING